MNAVLITLILAAAPYAVFSPGKFEINLVEQPAGERMYVPDQMGVGSLFQDASWYGSIGVLAHNYLSGSEFYELQEGDFVGLRYTNGVQWYRIREILWYTPTRWLTPEMVYRQVYTVSGRLVLQTCTSNGWMLAIAYPATEPVEAGLLRLPEAGAGPKTYRVMLPLAVREPSRLVSMSGGTHVD